MSWESKYVSASFLLEDLDAALYECGSWPTSEDGVEYRFKRREATRFKESVAWERSAEKAARAAVSAGEKREGWGSGDSLESSGRVISNIIMKEGGG